MAGAEGFSKLDLSNANLLIEMESNKALAQKGSILLNSLDLIVASSPALSQKATDAAWTTVHSLLPRQHPH